MSNLIDNIRTVLDLCNENVNRKALKTSSAKAKITTQFLLSVAHSLKKLISPEYLNQAYITVSYGSGYFPKVPWVAIVPNGKKVSNSISVTICFGNSGEGLVIGAMFPNKVTNGDYKTFIRNDNKVNVSGRNASTQYTNKFINPCDFAKDGISEASLVRHLNESIMLMNAYLKQSNSALTKSTQK